MNRIIKKRVQRGFYRTKLFYYLLAIFVVAVLSVGIFASYTFLNAASEKMEVSINASVRQTKSSVDTILYMIQHNYLGESNSDEIKWTMENKIKYSNYSHIMDAIRILNGSSVFTEYIASYAVINFRTGVSLSNRGMYDSNLIINRDTINELFESREDSLIYHQWYYSESDPQEGYEFLKREVIDVAGLNFVVHLPVIQKESYGLMVININKQKIEEILCQGLGDNNITVFDEDKIIFTTDMEVAGEILKNKDNIKQHSLEVLKCGDSTHMYAAEESDILNWTYVITGSRSGIYSDAIDIITSAVVVIAAMLLAAGISVILSGILYRPIRELTAMVSEITQEDETSQNNDMGDLEQLAAKIEHLANSRNFLKQMTGMQKKQLMELFQIRLLNGELEIEQINNYILQLGLEVRNFFIAAVMTFTAKDEKYDEEILHEMNRKISDACFPKDLFDDIYIRPICHENTVIFILAGDEEDGIYNKALAFHEKINGYCKEYFKQDINLGFSSLHTGLEYMRTAFREAVEALKNSCHGKKTAFYKDVLTSEKVQAYNYNLVLEREIKKAIEASDKETAFAKTDLFIEELLECSMPGNENYIHLYRLIMAILLLPINVGLPKIFDDDDVNIFIKASQIYDGEKIKGFLKYKVIDTVMNAMHNSHNNKAAEILAEVQDIIREGEGDISLTECAERMGYHPSYIWRILKQEKNITFTDYVAEYRLQRAKEMLTETDMSINQIAENLRYTNAQNFIRFFSKLEGTTPGKFRQMNSRIKSRQ